MRGATEGRPRRRRKPGGANVIRVTLPIVTKNPLNGGMALSKWAVFARTKERKEQRTIAGIAVRAALQANWPGLPVTITLTRVAPSSGLDDDNLRASMKSIRDGITDGFGLTNDRDPLLKWEYDQRRGPRKQYAVEVKIEGRASPLAAIPVADIRSEARRARWAAAEEEIRAGRYERPRRKP